MFCIRALRGRALPRVRVLERERGARARGRVALEAAQGRAALRAQVGQHLVGVVHLALHLGEVPDFFGEVLEKFERGPCWLVDERLALAVCARTCVGVRAGVWCCCCCRFALGAADL